MNFYEFTVAFGHFAASIFLVAASCRIIMTIELELTGIKKTIQATNEIFKLLVEETRKNELKRSNEKFKN